MPGLYYNFSLAKKISLTARTLAGIIHNTRPLIAVDVEDGGVDDETFEQKSVSKAAFSFDLGAGFS